MNSAGDAGRPLIVLVSGAPGSGKTTLARTLAEQMRLLHIPRDEFFWSQTYTADKPDGKRLANIFDYRDMLVYLAKHGVSMVTDGTLYRGKSEMDIARPLLEVARLVNIHCRAQNEKARFRTREIERNERYGHSIDWLDGHMQHLDDIYDDTAHPLDLGCPVIEVDTTAAYNPSVSTIAKRLGDRNNAERR